MRSTSLHRSLFNCYPSYSAKLSQHLHRALGQKISKYSPTNCFKYDSTKLIYRKGRIYKDCGTPCKIFRKDRTMRARTANVRASLINNKFTTTQELPKHQTPEDSYFPETMFIPHKNSVIIPSQHHVEMKKLSKSESTVKSRHAYLAFIL